MNEGRYLSESCDITLRLTREQSELFAETLCVQKQHKKSAIFAVVTDSYVPEEGGGVIRLESKLCSRRTAMKVSKLLREDCLETKKIELQ
jgi:hypothetical protein